jgi:thiol-disulfide isomerase/thioredoxin
MHSVLSVALAIVVGVALTACGPKKDKAPPKPQVTTGTGSPAAGVAALPMLGTAPAWSLKDVNGKVVTSDQFKGKTVVIDFWATWCGPCKVEIPGYIELAKKHAKDGLVIVGISVDEAGPEVVKDFVARNRINYPVVMYDENIIQAFGGVEGIPTTFLIDRTGQIRDKKIGAMETAEYEKKILAVLK